MISSLECSRTFGSEDALRAHSLAKAHYQCWQCQRSFTTEDGWHQHLRHSSAHDESEQDSETESDDEDGEPYCKGCDRWFVDMQSLYQHLAANPRHNWCFECSRDFGSPQALSQHSSSAVHKNRICLCPFCNSGFKTPSGVAHHIESGCHKLTRHQVTAAVHAARIVPDISVSQRLLGPTSAPRPRPIVHYSATEQAFNGSAYECYLCHRTFGSLVSLNTHLESPAHDNNEFRCPKCKSEFTLISGLIQHIESEACQLAKFNRVINEFENLTAQFSRLLKV